MTSGDILRLFLSVTPLKSAKRMAEGFGRDSGSLLIQEGRGHCTIAEPSVRFVVFSPTQSSLHTSD